MCCETGPTVYRRYPRRLESLNHLQMLLQRQHFLHSYLKTLSVGPAGALIPSPPAQLADARTTETTGLNLMASAKYMVTSPQRLSLSLSTILRMCRTRNLATIKIGGKLTCPKLTVLSNEIIELIEVVDADLERKNEKLVSLFNISA